MGSRTWIKVYCDKWIGGTLREESPEVRGVWIDLLALAGSGQYGDVGEVKLINGVGFTDGQICEILRIKPALWGRVKARLVETKRIEVSSKGAIRIVNWSKYQSEYTRQKPYREAKSMSATPEPKSPLANPLEIEKEKEREKLQGELQHKVTTESYKRGTMEPLRDTHGASPPETPKETLPTPPATFPGEQGNEATPPTTLHASLFPTRDAVARYLANMGPTQLDDLCDDLTSVPLDDGHKPFRVHIETVLKDTSRFEKTSDGWTYKEAQGK